MNRLKLFIPLLLLVLLLPLFYFGLNNDPNAMPSALIGDRVPPFSLPLVRDQNELQTERYFEGKVTLLNIWATWCFACKAEHPFLNKLAEQGVNIVGVNYKDDRQAAQKWLRDLHNPYEFSLFDAEGRLGLDLGVTGAPETYFIDREGVVRYRHIGVIDDENWQETLKPIYEKMLADS